MYIYIYVYIYILIQEWLFNVLHSFVIICHSSYSSFFFVFINLPMDHHTIPNRARQLTGHRVAAHRSDCRTPRSLGSLGAIAPTWQPTLRHWSKNPERSHTETCGDCHVTLVSSETHATPRDLAQRFCRQNPSVSCFRQLTESLKTGTHRIETQMTHISRCYVLPVRPRNIR